MENNEVILTPVEKMIRAVENGAYDNKSVWKLWKQTLLDYEDFYIKNKVTKEILYKKDAQSN